LTTEVFIAMQPIEKPDGTDAIETRAEPPRKRPRYKLADLLAQCDPNAPRNPECEEWLNAPSVGLEILPPYETE
jgi:hypothetical protein